MSGLQATCDPGTMKETADCSSAGGAEARRQGVRGRVPPVRQVRSKRENSFPQKSGKSFRRFDRGFPGADAENVPRTRPRVQGIKPCRGRVSGGGEQPLPTKNALPCIPPPADCRTTLRPASRRSRSSRDKGVMRSPVHFTSQTVPLRRDSSAAKTIRWLSSVSSTPVRIRDGSFSASAVTKLSIRPKSPPP